MWFLCVSRCTAAHAPSDCTAPHLLRKQVSQGQMTAIPAYSYPGIVSGLPVDQSGLRPAYPFMIPGQYVQVPYPQVRGGGEERREVWMFGSPIMGTVA